MILKVAWRSLVARPIRSAVLAVGFGLGVGVMAVLLGVGAVILDQARAPALVGGGDVVIGSASGHVPNAPFVLYALRPGGPFGRAVASVSPSESDTLYLRHDGRSVPIRVRGGIPSAERAFDDVETANVAGWTDTAADRAWIANDPSDVLRSIDRFHPIPDVPARAGSWAEWLYFNGIAQEGRFYLTFMAGPETAPGRRAVGVRLQLERNGVLTTYSTSAVEDTALVVAAAPDLTVNGNSVRLSGTEYRITLNVPAETGSARAIGTILVRGNPDRSVPPFVLEGTNGWLSGYTVPVMAGSLAGAVRVGREVVDLSGGTAYHDHNWGFWEGVSWQWGQVQHEGLSFVYGRVHPPADAADPSRVPGFLAVLGPDGPIAFSTDASIEETNAPGSDRPFHIVIRADSDALTATLDLDVTQTTVTRMRPGGVGDGLDFLQLRARYTVDARFSDKHVVFSAPGSAETFRGAPAPSTKHPN